MRDKGLYPTLPIPHRAKSVLYVDYTEMPKFGGYDFALVVTCGLTRLTRMFPCTKHITLYSPQCPSVYEDSLYSHE